MTDQSSDSAQTTKLLFASMTFLAFGLSDSTATQMKLSFVCLKKSESLG